MVSKVYIPFPALKVPLLFIPPLNSTGEFAEVLVHVPPALILTKPVNSFAPVAEDMVKLPLVPAPIVDVPVTVNAKASAVKVVLSPTERFPVIAKPTTVVVDTVPLKVKLPPIIVMAESNVLAPLPLRVRL